MKLKQLLLIAATIFTTIAFSSAYAASKEEIDAEVREAVANFYKHTSAGEELAKKASGMLVFPQVIKAGFGVGGEYGEGALIVNGETVGYYNIAAASIGLQIGSSAPAPTSACSASPRMAGRPGLMAAWHLPHWVPVVPLIPRPPKPPSSALYFPTRD